MTNPNFAEGLRDRLPAQREADRHSLRQLFGSQAHIATPDDAVANTAPGELRRQEAGTAAKHLDAMEANIATPEASVTKASWEAESAAKRVEALEAQIAKLENAVAIAEALGERRRREAETAAKRAEVLEAHVAQAAVGIKLAIMMGDGHFTDFDVERLRGIADSLAGLRTAS